MIQKRRYRELDFARTISMVFMPLVHVYEEFLMHGFATGEAESQGLIFIYMCMFGPAVFMISLGMNLVYSSHNTPKQLAIRGVKTIALFYVLNILRYVIPGSVAILSGDVDAKQSVLRHFFCSDILFFAGATFLFFAVMRKFSVKPFYILVISVLMLTLDMLIPKVQLENEILAIALGKYFYVNGWSCFPILSWMIYPAVGYCIGFVIESLQTEEARRTFWNRVILFSIVGLLAFGVCMVSYGLNPLRIAASPANEYKTDTANVVLELFLSGLHYGIYYYAHLPFRNTKFASGISVLSRGILVFYCVHWVFTGWLEYLMLAMGMRNQHVWGMGMIITSGLLIMVISILLTLCLQKYFGKKKVRNKV